jgi:hypothetical protein
MYRNIALVAALASLATLNGPPARAQADPATFALARAGTLTITAPGPTALGSASPNGQISMQLGTVQVVDSRGGGAGAWTAFVSSTDFTRTTAPVVTISKSNMSYWSGPPTVSQGGGLLVPGQANAHASENLNVPRMAFSRSKSTGSNNCSWAPTLILSIPATATAGNYSGTITHSVA